MNNISFYLIEDSVSYRMYFKNSITKYMNKHKLLLNFDVYPIQNYTKFYENLGTESINYNAIFIIDIYLNTYFTGIDLGKKILSINQKTCPSDYLMKSDDIEIMQIQLFKLFTPLNLNISDTDKTITGASYTSSIRLNISDINFISIFKEAKRKVIVKTLDSDLVVDGTLSSIKSKLSFPPFYFGFKSIIINSNKIKSISPFNHLITFKNGSELDMKTKTLYKLSTFQKGLK